MNYAKVFRIASARNVRLNDFDPHAPLFVLPSEHKWFRKLVISQIIVKTKEHTVTNQADTRSKRARAK
ncbi:MAG: hypothetical protein ABI560_00125 [Myxococcales bacterium]